MQKLLPVLGVLLVLQHCGTDRQPQPKPAYQRFVPIPPHHPTAMAIDTTSGDDKDWALDTKTGNLCRTWDWHYELGKPAKDPNFVPRDQATPLCSKLLALYPD